jgi:hypothetical protein
MRGLSGAHELLGESQYGLVSVGSKGDKSLPGTPHENAKGLTGTTDVVGLPCHSISDLVATLSTCGCAKNLKGPSIADFAEWCV